ncbi:substrate-binding periplasmic protein [Undibacterium sp. Ji22W]|uniref:substrate-binding periplasmic protein n=1 Tax=Undibacterium sp. Ji22W TaxID=3413038 RepID=UPI003BF03EBA
MTLARRSITSLIFSLCMSCTASLHAQTTLKFCFEDVAQEPWTVPDGTGLNIELLKRVEELLGEHFEFISKPWKRCQEEVRTGVIDGYFGAAVSADRQRFSVYPSLADGSIDTGSALNVDDTRVFINKSSKVSWDGKSLTKVNSPIIVQRGYLIGTILEKKGYKIREIRTLEEGLKLLANGDAEVAILQGIDALYLTKQDPRFKDQLQSLPLPYLSLHLYLPINQQRYQREPKRFQAIWNAIKSVRNSPSYQQLLENAGLR